MNYNAKKLFSKKVILITGGTGSFGSFITKKLLEYDPKCIIIFSRDEDKQYSLQQELIKYKNKLNFVIGDVRNKESLVESTKGVDIVLHAAALKQIPSSEYNIIEVVRTNVLGAQNVVNSCIENGVSKAIAISTDKAVEPVNVMGMTKAIQERIFTQGNFRGNGKTHFSCVRYGNVVASRGSVIPLFRKQIGSGGPVTVTHHEMTRFILTLKDATELIYCALTNMVGGEIFVPKIKPLRVIDLAQVMVEELKPKDKKIIESGIRPGEKIHETLISAVESMRAIEKNDYYVVLPQTKIENITHKYGVKPYNKNKIFDYSSDQVPYLNKSEIKDLLKAEKII